MTDQAAFEHISTFEQWDRDYYSPLSLGYYNRAVLRMLTCLEAKQNDVILDAGCGPGVHSIRVAQAGYAVHAIDLSEVVLGEARRRAGAAGVADRIRFEQSDLTNLRFPDGAFDRIFSWGVVIHISLAEEALAELGRILRPGGRLALEVTIARACDYTLLTIARGVLRRPGPTLVRFPLGQGCWYGSEPYRLWVWPFDL